MTTANVVNIVKGPSRLILTPTDLTAAFPYGGTELGMARSLEFHWGQRGHTVRAAEWGDAPVARIYCGDWGVLGAILRGWDVNAISTVFPNYVAGLSGAPTVQSTVNGSVRAGTVVTGAAILVVPLDSPTSLPAVLIYNALPQIEAASALNQSRKTEAGIGVAWEAAPDSAGRSFSIGILRDLTL